MFTFIFKCGVFLTLVTLLCLFTACSFVFRYMLCDKVQFCIFISAVFCRPETSITFSTASRDALLYIIGLTDGTMLVYITLYTRRILK